MKVNMGITVVGRCFRDLQNTIVLDTAMSISQGSCLRGPPLENPLNSLQGGI